MQHSLFSHSRNLTRALLLALGAVLLLGGSKAFAQQADLSITNTDSPDPVAPGATLTYTLTVANAGPSAANAVVMDTLQGGMTAVSATPSQGSCFRLIGSVNCSLGLLAVGASASVQIQVTAPAFTGTLTNIADVLSPATNDPDRTNNSASATTTVSAAVTQADLSITKTDSPDPVAPGATLTYTLTVANAGPSATSAVVIDTLPVGTTFVSAIPSQGDCSQLLGSVDCSLGLLAVGASASVQIQVTAPTEAGTLTNRAEVVTAATNDPDPANNSATVTTTVGAVVIQADLSLTKADAPDPVATGTTLTYTLTATNAGPAEAANATVTDTLPAGTTFVSAIPSQGDCTQAAGVVTCNLGTLAVGATANVQIQVTAPAEDSTLTNTATVSSAVTDPDPANNSASATTAVSAAVPRADLSLTSAGAPDPVMTGAQLTYTLTVTNAGPAEATNVTLRNDVVPLGDVSFVSATPSQGGCTGSLGSVRCGLETLAAGASASVQIQVTVNAPAGSTITSVAEVSSTEADPDPANNSATVTTAVSGAVTQADLSLTKADAPDPVVPGATLTYTLTATNAGPAEAANATVTDTLPAGTTFVSATPSQGDCTQAAGAVTCNLGTLAAGASASVQIQVTAPTTDGTLTNTASVSSAVADPNPENNAASATTTVSTTPPVPIPTVSAIGLVILNFLLAGLGAFWLRQRRPG